ncbi:MAG: glycosyltransferase family 4 protein [Acidobacteriia bacterium]|nr:glycosyltransferase family 4 protein [Terriglobia bacterium]
MKGPLRSLLRLIGKGEGKVAAVFGLTPSSCHTAVIHLRKGAPEVPVWLFSTQAPCAETASLCKWVYVNPGSLALVLQAQRQLWPHWVAIGVTTWTGEHGKWPVKLAPFLTPPFRALLLNEHGDFFRGTPMGILRHCGRRLRDVFHYGWHTAQDWGRGCWLLVSYHIWRSAPVTRARDEFAGLFALAATFGLRLVSALLLWCRYPHRPLFHRLRGSEPLDLPLDAGGGQGLARFSPTGRHWDGRKLEAFARSSDARWILWQEDAAARDSTDDFLPLFEDRRTFAVSRQTHFRAWKPMLFPTAPFRTLQTGEASQVLAPLSGTVVVDRRKLLALGILRCSLAGTAWMLLFWKAAAAGWRSYAVGQRRPLAEQPDFPMQETGFMLRFLSDAKLRSLGPREPDLSRGSIAFAPASQVAVRPPAGRLKVLVVSPFLPYPLSHGGAVRTYNLCRALADRVDFVLAAVRESEDVVDYDKLQEVFREVYVVDKDERASGSEELPAQVREHQSCALSALIGELSRTWKPDLLQIEYTHMAFVRPAAPDVPAILVEHDLTFSLYRQLAEKKDAGSAALREYERWLKFERYWLGAYDAVWTVSEDDCASAAREGNRPPGSTFAVPNGVDISRFVPREEPAATPEILYVGSFRHLPNILGFEKLREEVMSRVWGAFPDVRLRVVAGPQHELFWKRFVRKDAPPAFDARIEVHGFVEDLRPLYAKAAVVVVPLEVSAGTNIKVLEAMACGKAVVTTPIGCAGLGLRDRQDAFIDADWARFARSVGELLSDPALRAGVAAQARRTAEERFSWTAIAREAYEIYLGVVTHFRDFLVRL